MRFLSVTFRNFGPFAEQPLDLSACQCRLHVIYGLNEAGKSSALRGLRYFLFGFPGQAPDDFIYKYSQFRICAKLASAGGDSLECVRRKGNKDTLRAADDRAVIPEERLQSFVGGLKEEQFELLFGLDLNLLKQGGRMIAEGEGNLGEALFAAGAGLAGLRELGRQLEERKDALFKRKGHNQAIAGSLRTLKELKDKERASTLAAEAYATKDEEFRGFQKAAERSRQDRNEARVELGQLERYRTALPTISQLHTARERLRDVHAARALREGFEKDFRETATRLITSQTTVKNLRSDVEGLEADLAALALPSNLLAEEQIIDQLRELFGVWSGQRNEALRADTFRRDMEAKARDIFRELTGSTDLEQAYHYRPRLDQSDCLRALGREREGIGAELHTFAEQVRRRREELETAERDLGPGPDPPDPTVLRGLVEAVTSLGPLEQQLDQQEDACAAEEAALRDVLARLTPPCPVPLEGVAAWPAPTLEAVAWHRRELDQRVGELNQCRARLSEARESLTSLDSQMAALEHGEKVPSEGELMAARQERDGGLTRIREHLSGHPATLEDDDFIARHAPNRQLIDAVETSVRQCDGLADRLRHEADRVAQWQTLSSQRALLHDQIARSENDERTVYERLDRAQLEWRALWTPAGVAPQAPEVMLTWLNEILRIRERVENWLAAKTACAGLAQRIHRHRDELGGAVPEVRSAPSLLATLEAARAHADAAGTARATRAQLMAEVGRHRIELTHAESNHRDAVDRLRQWEEQWAAAVEPLRLAATVEVGTVETYLGRIADMHVHLKDARIKAARIREIEAGRDTFLHELNEVRCRIDAGARPSSVDSIETDFLDLDRRLADARTTRTQHRQLQEQIAAKGVQLETALRQQQEAEAGLAAMASEAGVADPAVLPDAIEGSRRLSEAEQHLGELEAALAQQAQGESADDFEAAALAHRESLGQSIDELNERIARIDKEVSQAEIAANKAEEQLKKWQEASEEAATARQEAAMLARQLQDQVTEYASLHLARRALDRAVERYRSRHQDSMLARAGAYFKNLTEGDFIGLEIDNEDGTTVLKALRSARDRPDASVSVDGLSDGTRDQLFLALRLAGVEHHLVDREPMPLIIDDVLVNFDDRRARATLRSLAELSARTQILLFTHHRHIVELARESVAPVLAYHELHQPK